MSGPSRSRQSTSRVVLFPPSRPSHSSTDILPWTVTTSPFLRADITYSRVARQQFTRNQTVCFLSPHPDVAATLSRAGPASLFAASGSDPRLPVNEIWIVISVFFLVGHRPLFLMFLG
uniref:SsDNA-binding protein n=1 Tax=uncultured marine virus TaxID=186617 RepID=A0A0F7L6K5_9VIRU|nr:ssDNA-binding protein [uncultured marine virus]